MLNQIKSVTYGFSLFPQLFGFVLVGKLSSVGAVFRTIILWRWKIRELPQSSIGQARGGGGWLNQKFDLRFFVLVGKVQRLVFKIMSHFGFLSFGFCL
ncbi:TPA: hypothetical protein ACGUVO_004442 [Vibrio vulnificus]